MRISDTTLLGLDTGAAAAPRKNRFSVNRTAGNMPTWKPKVEAANFAPSQLVSTKIETSQKPKFADLVDVINPLQHIPLVGHFYRKMTGDEISPFAQFIGSTVYGGPLGAVASLTDIAVREQTGKGGIDTMVGFFERGQGSEDIASPITLAKRWPEAPRTAGTMPVWGQDNNLGTLTNQTNPIPSGNLDPKTNFALLLNGLTSEA